MLGLAFLVESGLPVRRFLPRVVLRFVACLADFRTGSGHAARRRACSARLTRSVLRAGLGERLVCKRQQHREKCGKNEVQSRNPTRRSLLHEIPSPTFHTRSRPECPRCYTLSDDNMVTKLTIRCDARHSTSSSLNKPSSAVRARTLGTGPNCKRILSWRGCF